MSRFPLRLLLLLCSLIPAVGAFAGETEAKRAREATRVLDEIMQAPDRRIPTNLLAEAQAIAVIPDLIKAGLVVAFFMHLRWDRPFNAIVLLSALVFFMIFVGLALMDAWHYQSELIPGYGQLPP